MRIGDVLYFSPRFRFIDLDPGEAAGFVGALKDRLKGFYLDPAARLLDSGDAFAAGLLCCADVDFIALCSGRTSATEVVLEAVLARQGFVTTLRWRLGPELKSAEVARVLKEWTLPRMDLWVIYP
jgi:hypothetical protein